MRAFRYPFVARMGAGLGLANLFVYGLVAAGARWWLALVFTLGSVAWGVWAFRLRRDEWLAEQELRRQNVALQRSEGWYRTLHDATGDAMWIRENGRMVDCNQAALRILGATSKAQLCAFAPDQIWPPQQLNGQNSAEMATEMLALAREQGSVRIEWLFKRVDNGHVFTTEVLLNALYLDGKPVVQTVVHDITERKAAENQIRKLAYFDPLTDLPNRRLLMERLRMARENSAQSGQFGALLILDLDHFKILNDTLGHTVGDRLLIAVTQRIRRVLANKGIPGRLGGDEYVVLFENLGTDRAIAQRRAEAYAESVRTLLDQPYSLMDDGSSQHSTASIGVTLLNGIAAEEHILLKQADVALYQAKAAGRNAVRFYSPAMQEQIDARSAMEAALRASLQGTGFKLYYQPQISLDFGLVGAEALLRWFPEQHRVVSPALFVPVAEESGLILALGNWVLQTACVQLSEWNKRPETSHLKLAINVSARQFREPDFVNRIRQSLVSSGANPARLQLELTESVVVEQIDEVVSRMKEIRALGVTFSLDDFGTGFSSLSYLKKLPLDQIKIDQSFVRELITSSNDQAIVRAIIAISQSMGLQVIAEGVEDQDQLAFLGTLGCRVYQGYLLGRPVPIEEWGVAPGTVALLR